MGKYLSIVLAMMIVSMAISFFSPLDGSIREEPFYPLFWVSVGGAIVVIIYSSYQNRKNQQQLRRERRKKYKK
tara:strand:+ start:510 stop:728 length:219 start_codon:yes stop_codon:yes gene_type:complete